MEVRFRPQSALVRPTSTSQGTTERQSRPTSALRRNKGGSRPTSATILRGKRGASSTQGHRQPQSGTNNSYLSEPWNHENTTVAKRSSSTRPLSRLSNSGQKSPSRTASTLRGARPRPHSALARTSSAVAREDETRQYIKEIFDLCEQLRASHQFIAALQRNIQSYGNTPDLMMLRSLRDSLLEHKAATLKVLRRIEARERVLACLNHFVSNANAQMAAMSGKQEVLSEELENPVMVPSLSAPQTLEPTTQQQSASASRKGSTTSATLAEGRKSTAWGATSNTSHNSVSPITAADAGLPPAAAKQFLHSDNELPIGESSVPSFGQLQGLDPVVRAEGDAILESLHQCDHSVAEALGHWEESSGKIFQDDDHEFRWKGVNYARKMMSDASFFQEAKERWALQSAEMEELAAKEEREANNPLHQQAKEERQRALQKEHDDFLFKAAAKIQATFKAHQKRQWFEYEIMKKRAAKMIQRNYRLHLRGRKMELSERYHAVVAKVQALWRGTIQRRQTQKLLRLHNAAKKLQRFYRTQHARHLRDVAIRAAIVQREASCVLARAFRANMWKQRHHTYHVRRNTVIMLQRWIRRILRRMAQKQEEALVAEANAVLSRRSSSPCATVPEPVQRCRSATPEQQGGFSMDHHANTSFASHVPSSGQSPAPHSGRLSPLPPKAISMPHAIAERPREHEDLYEQRIHHHFRGGDVTFTVPKASRPQLLSENSAAVVHKDSNLNDGKRPPFSMDAPFWAGDLEAAVKIQATWARYKQRHAILGRAARVLARREKQQRVEEIDYFVSVVQAFCQWRISGSLTATRPDPQDVAALMIQSKWKETAPLREERRKQQQSSPTKRTRSPAKKSAQLPTEQAAPAAPPQVPPPLPAGLPNVGSGIAMHVTASTPLHSTDELNSREFESITGLLATAQPSSNDNLKKMVVSPSLMSLNSTDDKPVCSTTDSAEVATTGEKKSANVFPAMPPLPTPPVPSAAAVSAVATAHKGNTSATTAAARMRGLPSRRSVQDLEELKKRKNAAIKIATFCAKHLERHRRNAAQVMIARNYRQHVAYQDFKSKRDERRKILKQMEEERQAIKKMQENARRRREAALMIIYYILKFKHDALLRGLNEHCDHIRRLPDRNECAVKVQRVWRLYSSRKKMAALLRQKEQHQAQVARLAAQDAAALKIQSIYRRHQVRDELDTLRREEAIRKESAAQVIQRCGRRFQARTEFAQRRLEATSMFKELQRTREEVKRMKKRDLTEN